MIPNKPIYCQINKFTFPLLSQVIISLLSLCLMQFNQGSMSFAQSSVEKDTQQVISAHGVSGRAWLPEVELIVPEIEHHEYDLLSTLKPQIISQLKYIVGQFNGLEGGLELHTLKISDLQKKAALAGGFTIYRYTAEFNAILSPTNLADLKQTTTLSVFLPKSVDPVSLTELYHQYGKDCVPNPFGQYSAESYWYYFRPQAYYCPLNQPEYDSTAKLYSTNVYFDPVYQEQAEIMPNYEAMWKDNRLVVTAVYALVGGLLAEQGQESYQMVFQDLVRTYGTPISINKMSLLNAQRIDIDTPVIEAEFVTEHGILEVHLFLINSLDQPSHFEGDSLTSFFSDYNRLTQESDLIIYNGHARYGSNNSKLDALGQLTPSKHQLFFVNTCGSYTYGLPRLTKLSKDLNQAELYPSSYLDLVLNAMPAMGHEIAFMNLSFIHALVHQEDSYYSLLQRLYPKQQMLVLAHGPTQFEEDKTDVVFTQQEDRKPSLITVKRKPQTGCDSSKRSKLPLHYYLMLILLLIGIIRLNSFR